jgi:probable rRNA maturation factor
LSIKIFQDNIQFRLSGRIEIKHLIKDLISEEKEIVGDINIILTNDFSLKEINVEFLQHNYYTDVISFGESEGGRINGEIYISIDTVKKNAFNYNVSSNEELLRVIIHGILHLCGYEDKNEAERNRMRKKEDKWMEVYHRRNKDV